MKKEPIVFFNRNKPSGMGKQADIIDLCRKEKRVFIGYPPFKKDKKFDEHNIKSCTYDISKDKFTKEDINNPDYYRQVVKNQNLVRDAVPGSFVIIPRPESGWYYIGKIKKFELVDNPPWIKDYKKLRSKQKLGWEEQKGGHKYHVGDVVQSWIVEEFKAVSPFKFPGWIRHSLFGRSTIGRIKDLDIKDSDGHNRVHDIISRLYSGEDINVDAKSAKDKLLYFLSPETFEHFMCNLLLLEYENDQVWIHIGGSGDGGIDCIGFDKKSREVVGIAQCKLKKQSVKEMKKLLSDLNKSFKGKKFICNYYCTEKIEEGKDVEILNQERIFKLFKKHGASNYWKIIDERSEPRV